MSTIPEKIPGGNAEKYYSYREAWTRINASLEHGFYFEAITIQESIISDRLIEYLVAIGDVEPAAELHRYPNFHDLISRWKKDQPQPIAEGPFPDLQGEVDQWRRKRNLILHNIVRSHPGAPTAPIDEFVSTAEEAARTGVALARALTNWTDRAVRAIRKQAEG
jgi:hypothetical protein